MTESTTLATDWIAAMLLRAAALLATIADRLTVAAMLITATARLNTEPA